MPRFYKYKNAQFHFDFEILIFFFMGKTFELLKKEVTEEKKLLAKHKNIFIDFFQAG